MPLDYQLLHITKKRPISLVTGHGLHNCPLVVTWEHNTSRLCFHDHLGHLPPFQFSLAFSGFHHLPASHSSSEISPLLSQMPLCKIHKAVLAQVHAMIRRHCPLVLLPLAFHGTSASAQEEVKPLLSLFLDHPVQGFMREGGKMTMEPPQNERRHCYSINLSILAGSKIHRA